MGEQVKKRFVIRDGDQKDYQARSRIIAFLESVNADPAIQVDIKPYRRNRSVAQNALYWKWVTIIGNELGNTKEEQHRDLKGRYLLPILVRDDDDVARIFLILETQKDADFKPLVSVLSTKHLDTKQFTEYLTDVEHMAGELGIMLPHPSDTYYEAMGIRR